MRYISAISAILIFFTMNIVGTFSGTSPALSCSRAIKGALIAYVIMTIACKCVIHVLLSQIAAEKYKKEQQEKQIKEEAKAKQNQKNAKNNR